MRRRDDEEGLDPDAWFAEFERRARGEAPAAGEPVREAPSAPEPSEPSPADPDTMHAMPPSDPEATQSLPPFDPLATPPMARAPIAPSPPPQPPILPKGEPPLPEPPAAWPPAEPGADEPSAIDLLFGEQSFREYPASLVGPRETSPRPAAGPQPAASRELVPVPADPGTPPPRGPNRTVRVLMGIGGGLLAVIALVALFLLGTRLPDWLGPAPAISPSPSPSPTPPVLVGPVAPGDYRWNELLGGECLDPFVDAWQEEYTVVDCDAPHPAQLVLRGEFDRAEFPVFPGVEQLQAQIAVLCTAPGVVDLAAAGAYRDVQVQGSYPVDAGQWREDRSYYCFVSRSSGEPLTGSVAVPPPAPEEEPAPSEG